MGERVLAICEGEAGAIHHRALAAAALAQRFGAESADVLVVGAAPAPPGRWSHALRLDPAEGAALAEPLGALIACGYSLVTFGDTPLLREIAGRLAARHNLPLVASVQGLRRRDGQLVASRPALGGARTANFALAGQPALLVVHPDAADASPTASPPPPAFETLNGAASIPAFRLLEETRLGPMEMDVTEADVVVAGGRGVGGSEGFGLLRELAELLGGSVGASRVAVDAGWVPYARQVGLTGKSVAPRLYVACGISGAIHHTLGMRDSAFIVAINNDARAAIFKIANVSIVGDLQEVLPALIANLSARSSRIERIGALAGAAG